MEEKIQFFKINQQCIKNLADIKEALEVVETKGESTMVMCRIRLTLMATLEQIQKDNPPVDTSAIKKEVGK